VGHNVGLVIDVRVFCLVLSSGKEPWHNICVFLPLGIRAVIWNVVQALLLRRKFGGREMTPYFI
jgi:hypothetical protein